MKNGLILEEGELIYYKNGVACHIGVIKCGEEIYYIGKGGKAVKGKHFIHESMSNGLIESGMYEFDDECKLVRKIHVKQEKNKRKGNKKLLKTVLISLLFFCFFALIAFSLLADNCLYNNLDNLSGSEEKGENLSSDGSALEIVIPEIKEEILLCSEEAKKLYDGDISIQDIVKTGNPYRSMKFEYTIYNEKDWKMLLSENEDMSSAREFVLLSSENVLDIDNLKTDKKYFYEIFGGGETVLKGDFKTAPSFRFIFMDKVKNVRDIGGIKTKDGKTLKQGMIIRGPELDGLVENGYFVSSKDMENIAKTLNIKYDFDLRSSTLFGGNYVSRFGSEVEHDFYNAPAYGTIFYENVKESMRIIFSSLADENKYPMYLHCTHGADRTGCVVFLLQALLGVSEEDAVREYRLTAFQHDNFADNNGIEIVLVGLNSYEGNTLNEKAHNYLVNSIGVTEKEIESIKNILLE